MIIVGIVMVMAPNNRESQVNAYNAAIASFNTNIYAGWTGTIAGNSAQQQTTNINVEGNMEGINQGQSSVMAANVNGQPVTVNFNFNNLATSFSRSPSFTKNNVNFISCSSRYSSVNEYCSPSSMLQKCRDQYGSGASYSGGGCYESRGNCGSCSYMSYLQSFCAVITQSSGGGWVDSSSKRSCQYPFTSVDDQIYGASSVSNVPFTMYTSSDPYLVLQAQTDGSNNFGLTRSQQTKIGVGLAAGGGVLVAVVIVGIFVVTKMISGQQKPPPVAPALPIIHDDPFNVPMVPPHAYGQPGYVAPTAPRPGYGYAPQGQQQYASPQQGYIQPQPAYGQPQPVYGQPQGFAQQPQQYSQPPPVYGQPQPAYGQPQPAYGQPGYNPAATIY